MKKMLLFVLLLSNIFAYTDIASENRPEKRSRTKTKREKVKEGEQPKDHKKLIMFVSVAILTTVGILYAYQSNENEVPPLPQMDEETAGKWSDALKEGNVETIKKLLAENDNINAQRENGDTVLDMTVTSEQHYKRKEIIKLLLNNKANLIRPDNLSQLFFDAMDDDDLEVIKLLCDNFGFDVEVKTRIIFDFGSYEYQEGGHPLNIATREFFGYGKDKAHKDKYKKLLNLLLEKGAKNITKENLFKLYDYVIGDATEENVKMITQLLGNGVNPNEQNDDKKDSLLHMAIRKGKEEIVKVALDKGADVSLTNKSGSSCVDVAKLYKGGSPSIYTLVSEAQAVPQ